jgi:hypothetical protein
VKVLDFGIAKAEERATKTVGGTIKGKYGYMSPEQCKGKPIDRRSDIFALGIVLYELTTLRRAFKGNDDFETMKRIVSGDVMLPSVAVPGYPPELESIVLTAMANEPGARFQTAQELIEAIDVFAVRAKLTGSNTAMGRYMTQLFGGRREPWVSAGLAAGALAESRERARTASGDDGLGDATEIATEVPGAGELDDDDEDLEDQQTVLIEARSDLFKPRPEAARSAPDAHTAPMQRHTPPGGNDAAAWRSDAGYGARRNARVTASRIEVVPLAQPIGPTPAGGAAEIGGASAGAPRVGDAMGPALHGSGSGAMAMPSGAPPPSGPFALPGPLTGSAPAATPVGPPRGLAPPGPFAPFGAALPGDASEPGSHPGGRPLLDDPRLGWDPAAAYRMIAPPRLERDPGAARLRSSWWWFLLAGVIITAISLAAVLALTAE